MSCSINALEGERERERLPNGLIIGHAYGISDMRKIKAPFWKRNKRNPGEVILMRLHNPWGEVEWNGAWSDKSEEWNKISESKRIKLGFKVADDGDFWMSFDDWVVFSTNTFV